LEEDQLFELINHIRTNKIIPLKYAYLGQGAHNWDNFYNRLENTEDIELRCYRLDAHIFLLEKAFSFLDTYLANFDRINIIEIGQGNSKPIFSIVDHFIKSRKLGKYIAIDISSKMLEISKNNFSSRFPNQYFNSHVLDIETSSLQNILFLTEEN